ncbi:MAG TPA: fibronectin type III domain-containing protein [Phycisphaerales bacterium]|nr:fibronectin type III domain-containing protein [Phycisphaerales bacterium]
MPRICTSGQSPQPCKPQPASAPAQPKELAARLISGDGALEISWKARNPRGTQGTTYIVRRRLAGEREFSFLGVTGAKRFTDNTVPAGVTGVEYTVQGQRADVSGPWSPILSVALGSARAAPGVPAAQNGPPLLARIPA